MSEKNIIEFNDFVRFLGSFGDKRHECPFCHSSKWTLTAGVKQVVDDKNGGVTSLIPLGTTSEPPSGLISGGLNVLIMSCNECGYINLFDHHIVLKRLNKLSKKEDSESAEAASE
ncbi:hypothetical protein [Pluralibacter gergoviae]|uniref:hypothetical protein n=1 Tax=Pluralibacter gergoviae TaxID=61647 RepID=UPI0012DACDCB|nr:hypothetical protein [Pluralibacter gergoviae]